MLMLQVVETLDVVRIIQYMICRQPQFQQLAIQFLWYFTESREFCIMLIKKLQSDGYVQLIPFVCDIIKVSPLGFDILAQLCMEQEVLNIATRDNPFIDLIAKYMKDNCYVESGIRLLTVLFRSPMQYVTYENLIIP